MRKPEMILFDYGHTLIYEREFDCICGTKAVMEHGVKNRDDLTVEVINKRSTEIFEDIGRTVRSQGMEIHNHMFQRLLYESLGIELSLTPSECEQIFWDNASPGKAMPYAEDMLDYLESQSIRTGVISNIAFSGEALKERLDKLLPNNHFEFVIASSEYVYRKPNPLIFEVALQKAFLRSDEVWFCGDNIQADILGAHNAGIFPVWYESNLVCSYKQKEQTKPSCDHLHIMSWLELIQILKV